MIFSFARVVELNAFKIHYNFVVAQRTIQIKKIGPLKYPKSTLIVLRKCHKMKKRPVTFLFFLDNLKVPRPKLLQRVFWCSRIATNRLGCDTR